MRLLEISAIYLLPNQEQNCKGEDCAGEEEVGENEEEEVGENEEEEEEECDSNGKKRKRNSPTKKKKANNCNSKTTPRSRASKKVAVNRKEISCKKVDESDSPDIIRSDFFPKNTEKGNQESEQNEHISVVENTESCSPNSPANKRTPRKLKRKPNSVVEEQKKTRTTPKKKVVNCGQKDLMSKKTLSEILLDGSPQQVIPNLRLEAKITAEENSRLFAGRQIHPFFSSWKTSKRNQEIIDVENTCCNSEKKEPSLVFNPIHVFDMVEDDALSLDWGNWLLYESNSLTNSYDMEISSSSAYEGHVNPLQFDDISSIGCPAIALECQNEISPDQCHITLNKDSLVDRIEASCTSISCNSKWHGSFVQQSYGNQQENCLWTDKFKPKKATQICGNTESVKFLIEWLCMWHEKGSHTRKSSFHDDKAVEQDTDYCCYQSDPDSDNVDDQTSLNNVLLITGPVGSGKSAAIYACAEDQGFQVIEVNASDWRNGALVKQKFGEALESHWLQHKVDKTANSEKKPPSMSFPDIIGVAKGSENEVVELIPSSDEDFQLNCKMPDKSTCGENTVHDTENATMTLILFEDVDVVLSDDHGFLSAIQQLAQKAKRPMILTANSNNCILPTNLKRLEVSFGVPSSKELLRLGHLVCEAEKAKVHPWLIERLVESCQGDIRKTITHLQFWCQGQSSRIGNRSEITYSPLPFDVQAGHHILPKLMPWSCTSQLSEIVEEEINRSLITMEKRSSMEILAEEELLDGTSHRTSRFHGGETDSIDAKKEAILSLHCSTYSEDDLLPLPDCRFQTSNSSGSPFAFSKRNVRRKLEAVISSDSEEENLGDSAPTNIVRAFCDENDTLLYVNSISSPHLFTIGRCCQQTDHLSHIEEDKVEQTSIECSENGNHPQTDGPCTSMDMSCVPESSFVPETEVDDKTEVFSAAVSGSFVLHKQQANCMSNNVLTNSILVKSEDCHTPLHNNHEMPGNGGDVDRATLPREEVGDSHLEHVEDGIKQYPPMLDECSRIEYTGGVKNLEKLRPHQQIDSVEETWRRLRECNMDLQQYITLEEKDVFRDLKVALGMSDLISEIDLLQSSCQPQIYDLVEPSLIPCESTQLCSWYDEHLHMSSTMAQHGICFYTKKAVALGSKRGSLGTVDLAWEMLSSSDNKMALGKLLSLDSKVMQITEMRSQISCSSLRREMNSSLCNILQSLVSTRAHLSMRGNAFHDYLASLSKISKLESIRLSEQASVRKQRRARIARHYLSSGTRTLSPDDISLLSQRSYYRKFLPNQEIEVGKTLCRR